MRDRRPAVVWVGALLLFATLFGIAGATLCGRAPAPADAPVPAPVTPFIAPGREAVVMAFLRGFGPTFAGHALGDTQIEKDEIRVQLEWAAEDAGAASSAPCVGPAWVRAPGGLRFRYGKVELWRNGSDVATGAVISGDLTLEFYLCGPEAKAHAYVAEAPRALDRAWEAVQPTRIWTTVASPPSPAVAPIGAGLLTPVVAATGIAAAWIAIAAWISGFALALVAPLARRGGATPAPIEPVRATVVSLVAAALVVAGALVRLRLATSLALDGDEPWAFPSAHPILTDDHDAWIHPPLFRALQACWVGLARFHAGDSLVVLRAPSLVASSIAVVLVARAAWRSGSLVALLSVVVVALSPAVVGDGVLARPYGLAACFVTVVVAALFAPTSPRDSGQASSGLRLSLALVAFGAAAWTDLLAGLVAGLALLLALTRPDFGWRARASVVVGAAAWVSPLVPGALVAIATQVTPPPLTPGAPVPDLAPIHGLGNGSLLLAFDAVASFTVFGAPIASTALGLLLLGGLVLLLLATRTTAAFPLSLLPLASLALVVAVAGRIGLRTRNILFLPHVAALAFAAAAPTLLLVARRRR